VLGVAGSARGVWAPVQGACSTQVVDLQSHFTWAKTHAGTHQQLFDNAQHCLNTMVQVHARLHARSTDLEAGDRMSCHTKRYRKRTAREVDKGTNKHGICAPASNFALLQADCSLWRERVFFCVHSRAPLNNHNCAAKVYCIKHGQLHAIMQNCRGVSLSKLTTHLISRCKLLTE